MGMFESKMILLKIDRVTISILNNGSEIAKTQKIIYVAFEKSKF